MTFIDPVPPPERLVGQQIHPGFGVVSLRRDGVEVLRDSKGDLELATYDSWARGGPDASPVWTLHIDGPLESYVYALTSDGEWTLIERRDGFA